MYIPIMRVLCVGRHPFLSEHLGRFFETLGVETIPCVGMAEAEVVARQRGPDAVICEYDLLATISLDRWENDPVLVADSSHCGQPNPASRRGTSARHQRHRGLSLSPDARSRRRASLVGGSPAQTRWRDSTRRAPVAGFETGRAAPLSGGGDDARAFFPSEPLLDALAATAADGRARCVELGHFGGRKIDVSVCVDRDGKVVIGLSDDMVGDSEPLRRLARQMAAETDTDAILEILCDAACEECDANGAGVLKAVANEGELVAAIGPLAVARGRRFALPGSLAREVIRKRDVVSVDDFGAGSLAAVAGRARASRRTRCSSLR